MTKLRWGLLSTARINRALIPAIRASQHGELAAVASRDAGRAADYAREWEIPRAYGSYDALLADPEIDVVYNALPNSLHSAWSLAALRAGKHVLCEKPFALSVEDARAMFAAAREAGRVIAEAFMYRYHPRTRQLREQIEAGAIGAPRLLRASFSFTLDRPADPRWDLGLGGGALWDVGCYPVSLARYLFDEAPERVLAWQQATERGVDETFVATLVHSGERVAQFDCSFAAPFRTHAEVVGSEGVITLATPFRPDAAEAGLVLRRGDQTETLPLADNPDRYLAEVEDLHAQILSGRAPGMPEAETIDNVATILRLYAAARGGGQD
jgi:predicted dehydrogenase